MSYPMEGAMLRQLFTYFAPTRNHAVADSAAIGHNSMANSAHASSAFKESNFMDEIYHHGLCAQGRIALNIDSGHQQQRRFHMVLDAIAVLLWGGSLFGLMWLGFAAGF